MTMKRINVTTTAYEGDVEFPEAQYYPEFVASELTRRLGVPVECSVAGKTAAHLYGYEDREEYDLQHEIISLVKVDLWNDFCDQGYEAYSARTTAA
jgi:hypothetical protein